MALLLHGPVATVQSVHTASFKENVDRTTFVVSLEAARSRQGSCSGYRQPGPRPQVEIADVGEVWRGTIGLQSCKQVGGCALQLFMGLVADRDPQSR